MYILPFRRMLSDPYVLAKAAIFAALAWLCLGQILPGVLYLWETRHVTGTLNVTPRLHAELVRTLQDKLAQRYLDPQTSMDMVDALRRGEREGWFDGITSPGEFARELTRTLRDTSNDPHIAIEFRPAGVPVFEERNFPAPQKEEILSLPARLVDRVGRWQASFGVDKVSASNAGIGYIRLSGFFRPYLAAEKYAAAMDEIAGSRALILDLRDNGGGSRDSVALLASYFFDQPTHLSDVVAPRSGERLRMWTRKDIGGTPYGGKRPVYILTSSRTFSAGEDFAYAMQTRGRAIVVGEATGGGAHPIAPFRLNEHFVALIPVAQSISPVTQTNWEGVGVRPDIPVPANQARSVATIAILKRQLAAETDPKRRARIQDWLAQER